MFHLKYSKNLISISCRGAQLSPPMHCCWVCVLLWHQLYSTVVFVAWNSLSQFLNNWWTGFRQSVFTQHIPYFQIQSLIDSKMSLEQLSQGKFEDCVLYKVDKKCQKTCLGHSTSTPPSSTFRLGQDTSWLTMSSSSPLTPLSAKLSCPSCWAPFPHGRTSWRLPTGLATT